MERSSKLFDEFLKHFNNKNIDDYKNLDIKHKKIVLSASDKILNSKKYFLKNLFSWESQNDFYYPPQISMMHLKRLNIIELLKKLIEIMFFWRHIPSKNAFYDDLKILEKSNCLDLIKLNPVHLESSRKDFFVYKKFTTNTRWNRYAYISAKIRDKKILTDTSNHLDVGSYYGGLQSFLKKIHTNTNYYMVDFNHQLLRSYIFLKKMFPESNHILLTNKADILDFKNIKGSFIYVSIEYFNKLNDIKFDLVTNFFSLGEMKEKDFSYYFNSNAFNNSKFIYLVNRTVSSPFFEKTYNNNTNLLDYLKKINFKIDYFDVFPIGNYLNVKRDFMGKKKYRPLSSNHFELILKNSE